jgi:hypothetical protein
MFVNLENVHQRHIQHQEEVEICQQEAERRIQALKTQKDIEIQELKITFEKELERVKAKAHDEKLISEQKLKAYMNKLKELNMRLKSAKKLLKMKQSADQTHSVRSDSTFSD